ncbi:sigma-70 family RNA polymerase sigma factor [Dactylosporangium sp. NPDC049140]|uniref:RNA polymerase sigma factor n=1 Tax=Dactylosporangium sp. NPDC049140 TaxID=3155647 RepID=UPI0033F1F9B5
MERGEEWFTRLFAAHFEAVVRYAFRRVFDAGVATDLAQEAFIVAWRRRDDVPVRELPWLYGVARNVIANHRRGKAPPVVPHETALRAGFEDTSAEMVDVLRAISALPERDQEILRLVAWEELELREAAVVLGCSKSAAAVRLHRARKRLQAALGEYREVEHV